jgi:hypothetical protein
MKKNRHQHLIQAVKTKSEAGPKVLPVPGLTKLGVKIDTQHAEVMASARTSQENTNKKIKELSDHISEATSVLDPMSANTEQTKMAATEAKVAAQFAAEKAIAAKESSDAARAAVDDRLIPQYDALQAVKMKDQREAVRTVLREVELPTVDREIIELHYQNKSQDKIVTELRRQGRGKTKKYVGNVIKTFNATLKAKGLKVKERVTGEDLTPAWGYTDSKAAEPIINVTPGTQAIDNDRGEQEVETTVAAWDKAEMPQKKILENYYSWLPIELKMRGRKPLTKPK